MKKFAIILCVLSLVLWIGGTGWASPYYGPILMVEADPNVSFDVPAETDVTFNVLFFDENWTVGESVGGSFVAFNDEDTNSDGIAVTKPGGTVVDFAIQQNSSQPDDFLALSDKTHAVTFVGAPNEGYPEAPNWVTEWYDDLAIVWNNGPTVNFEMVTTDGDPDGLAAVSIPSAVWLLGSGLIGLLGFRRKFRN